MIRLNDLKNFIEVSSCTSLSQAAQKMELTQPALSESIARLEKDLAIKLFYRTKNGITLTPQGRKTLDQVKDINRLIQNLGSNQIETPETIVLGCHVAVANYFIPQLFSTMGTIAPGHTIQLKHDLSRNIQMEIQAGRIDVGVIVNATSNPDLIVKKVSEDTMCVWKSKKKIPQNQILADLDLFQSQAILKKWNHAPKQIISLEALDLVARMTHLGCGYGIIPKRTVDLLKLDLIQVENTPTYKDHFSIVYRPEFGKTNYQKKFLDTIYEIFK